MKQKSAPIILLNLALMSFLTACPFYQAGSNEGIPDPLGSWENINQLIYRPSDWQQIVEDKQFALGEIEDTPTYSGNTEFYKQSYGTFPAIDGSTVLLPMAAEFGWQYLDLSSSQTQTFFKFSTTHSAYLKLIGAHPTSNNTSGFLYKYSTPTNYQYNFEKRPDLVIATAPSIGELATAASFGITMMVEPVCYDSFVFITHKDNPVDSLSVSQIQQIYAGEITNWSQVGGDDSEIVAYQREPGSGSQTAMEEMVMKGMTMTSAPMAKIVYAMGNLVNVVAGYENGLMSLGYTYKYYVDRLYTNPNIKILKVNDVTPSDENVRDNSYPFIAAYNAVIRNTDYNLTGGKFLQWMLSEEGQRCIAQAGYVTLNDVQQNNVN